MAITYDKDGAYIEVTDSVTGAVHRRSIKWEDCVVSVPNGTNLKIDSVYVNDSDQLVLVLSDESEITVAGGVGAHGDLTGVTANQHHVEFTLTEHTTIGNSAPHHAEAHTLTSHSTKAHSELSDAPEGAHHTKFTTTEHSAIGDGAPHHTKYTDAEAKTQAEGAKLDDHATPDDNTDLDATTSVHGLLKKLDNTVTNFMDGTGNWSAPAGGVSAEQALAYALSS